MENLKNMVNSIGLKVEFDGNKLKGYSLNIIQYPIFRLWINKRGNLTVKTRGIQKSFKNWNDLVTLRKILEGFEII